MAFAARPAPTQKKSAGWELPNDKILCAVVFFTALFLRLIFILQLLPAPYFDHPIADSLIYFKRAQEIMGGNLWGHAIPFHSSPVYSLFMAGVLGIFGNSFFLLRLFQIIIGSANCVLIYGLTKKLAGGDRLTALVGGTMAAGYGILAFFDGDLLMIFLTLFFIDAALLLLIKAQARAGICWALLAGLAWGLAALDKTNLLLFLPVGAWYLAGEFSVKIKDWKWKPAGGFILGTLLMVLPMTLNNYFLEQDLVLVSSNAGVNLFIGNNPDARGIFYLPPGSGLSNADLHGSSVATAEREMGRKLRPSEVSRFWTRKAVGFIRESPFRAIGNSGKKLRLIWNRLEIPNHLSFYYVRAEFAPVLKVLFLGFWLIAPLALVGIIGRISRNLGSTDKLFISFLLTYMVSLLPFFIASRYRLPMVPVLIAFAAVAVIRLSRMVRERSWKALGGMVLVFIGAWGMVNNTPDLLITYTHNRLAVAQKYLGRALRGAPTAEQDMQRAIVEYKHAMEADPPGEMDYYNLAHAYEKIGYYSGTIRMIQAAQALHPAREKENRALESIREKYQHTGDKISAHQVPQTLFEKAKRFEKNKKYTAAENLYVYLISRDPFHAAAYNELGALYFHRQEYKKAVKIWKRGIGKSRDDFVMIKNLAVLYRRLGEKQKAKKLFQRCLEIRPQDQDVRRQLRKGSL